MEHTFLFSQGRWTVRGLLSDAGNKILPVEGEIIIKHKERAWYNKGTLKLLVPGGKPECFENLYEIVPFAPLCDQSTWLSHNPTMGTLRGSIAVIYDAIVMYYSCGPYSGAEFVIKQSEDFYQCRGYSMKDGRKLSSWSTELIWEPPSGL